MIRVDALPCMTCGAITVEATCILCALEAAVTPAQRTEVWRAVEKQRAAIVREQAARTSAVARNLEASPW